MLEIRDLLSNIKDKIFAEESKIDLIKNVIMELTGIEIKNFDLRLNNGTLIINTKPIYKNQIFLKKEIILEVLEEKLGNKSPKEIL